MTLIHCEVSLTLNWSENCVLTNITTQAAEEDNPAIGALTSAIFKIENTKLYVLVVTLSSKYDNNFLEQLKSGLKRTIKWNMYRSEMANQTETIHFNYLIDPKFNKFNRLKMKKTEHLFQSIMYQKLK